MVRTQNLSTFKEPSKAEAGKDTSGGWVVKEEWILIGEKG